MYFPSTTLYLHAKNTYTEAKPISPPLLTSSLTLGIAHDINRELSIVYIVPRLRRARATLPASMAAQRTYETRRIGSRACRAALEVSADLAGASNLLARCVAAIAGPDVIDNYLEVEDVAGNSRRWTQAGASAVDSKCVGGGHEGKG